MGENPAFGSRRPSPAVIARLAKFAKMQRPDLVPCLDTLLELATDYRTGFQRRKAIPMAAFSKQWRNIARDLAKAETAFGNRESGRAMLFDLIVHGRLYKQAADTPDVKLLQIILAEGQSPFSRYAELLAGLRHLAEVVRDSIAKAPPHRPTSRIGGKDWTEKHAFAADVYHAITHAGGTLGTNRNDGGSFSQFLRELKPYSQIDPPSGSRVLERIKREVDSNFPKLTA